jgi:sulfate adenylyltransferase
MSETRRLIPPYGGQLIDLMVDSQAQAEVRAQAARLPSLQISERCACDLELLATGGFSPLRSFMGRADYERVLSEMRLAGGALFPIPVTLPVDPSEAIQLDRGALRDRRMICWPSCASRTCTPWDLPTAARHAFGTTDPKPRWSPRFTAGGRSTWSDR